MGINGEDGITASHAVNGGNFVHNPGVKTLKQEEIDARPYATMEDLEQHIAEFIEQVYNKVRLHSALDYLSPEQFEARQTQPGVISSWLPACLSFRRHKEVGPTPSMGKSA